MTRTLGRICFNKTDVAHFQQQKREPPNRGSVDHDENTTYSHRQIPYALDLFLQLFDSLSPVPLQDRLVDPVLLPIKFLLRSQRSSFVRPIQAWDTSLTSASSSTLVIKRGAMTACLINFVWSGTPRIRCHRSLVLLHIASVGVSVVFARAQRLLQSIRHLSGNCRRRSRRVRPARWRRRRQRCRGRCGAACPGTTARGWDRPVSGKQWIILRVGRVVVVKGHQGVFRVTPG